jgi:hypothetical protein
MAELELRRSISFSISRLVRVLDPRGQPQKAASQAPLSRPEARPAGLIGRLPFTFAAGYSCAPSRPSADGVFALALG